VYSGEYRYISIKLRETRAYTRTHTVVVVVVVFKPLRTRCTHPRHDHTITREGSTDAADGLGVSTMGALSSYSVQSVYVSTEISAALPSSRGATQRSVALPTARRFARRGAPSAASRPRRKQ